MKKGSLHICFIVPGYPTQEEPIFTFVRQLIVSLADLGIRCTVIAPTSISKSIFRKSQKRDYFWQDVTNRGNIIDIYQPRVISFSNLNIYGVNLSIYMNHLAILNTFNKLKLNPDILYAHFWDSGLTASLLGNKYNIPTFIATGESKIDVHKKFPHKMIKKHLKDISGVIAVSSKNKDESINLKLATEDMIEVFPNAIDDKLFYSMDKIKVREKLGFNTDDFIIAYTGTFNNRKGILRVSEAIKGLKGVKAIYIGSGDLKPDTENSLHIGRLPHEKIPFYLNSADVFVLPTLAEGASNAIIEAMACGLPIISSDRTFNNDILFKDNSVRVDPMNINEIKKAITLLRDNTNLRDKMAKASLKHAESFKIEDRAKKILNFMTKNIE